MKIVKIDYRVEEFCCNPMRAAIEKTGILKFDIDWYGDVMFESIIQIHYCPWCGEKIEAEK